MDPVLMIRVVAIGLSVVGVTALLITLRDIRERQPFPADGTLWIGEPLAPEVTLVERPSEPQRWIIVDFEGERIIEATTPHGFQVLRVGSDHLLGLHRDESGVEAVRRYPLHKSGGME